MASALAVGTAEARNLLKPIGDASCDLALQIIRSFCDEDFLKASAWQKVIDVPASGLSETMKNLSMSIYSLKPARTARRAGIAVVTFSKANDSKGPYVNLSLPFQKND